MRPNDAEVKILTNGRFAPEAAVQPRSQCSRAGIDCGLFARFNLTASALLDAPFSDGGRAGRKPNGFEL
jgi:hypothetical protein